MQSKETNAKGKTFKRELAVALFIWLVYLVETKEPDLVEVLTFPIFTFGALAFGMSWYSPNGGLLKSSGPSHGGRDERSSEHTSREDQQPNNRDNQRHRTEVGKTSSEGHTTDSRHQQGKL